MFSTPPTATAPDTGQPLLEVKALSVELGFGAVRATILNQVGLAVARGQTVGLVGESGSGKSTMAKTLVGELTPGSGSATFDGQSLHGLNRAGQRAMRRRIQMIPQDPYSSLNPRRTIGDALGEAIDPVRGNATRQAEAIAHWLNVVSMDSDVASRYPHEFSGGQRQRIAIARALAVQPELVIADEITSALDLTTQAEILNLLAELRQDLGLTMLFISHNLAVVRHVCDDVVVLYRGDVVEAGAVESVFTDPQHPYTRTLLDSVPGGPGFNIDADIRGGGVDG
ncbi:ATP-binding cassette domain-containing protein [Paenarthrobacter sp. A20]|uniref:ATP-binding cassette domain-containing protein n=1 Tax=Paenarthrobacter sp. A20 TaxID=2817891 RepID=UPI00209FF668|nr:ATP-binding cassette domain-containing protein [Paenarthrobacter sp. A20]MCP1415755.1 ABC-type glutathione transport system ATPase component [Paenarthrobacter sp. A20]